ncbi:methyltransferase domain-containing protein [Streptomyces gobiensis]|uniref:methyltransferase domain-containing protein n=1 Tax=Streptomyces gobiensis TaxID=2875706 RepID=UPI001E624723|nr:methyltransferase domain-containing protein [Streptomyces gobiensis]UGY91348.1 methyltransferase domain-containing protein [Streptomyces gobiensis]
MTHAVPLAPDEQRGLASLVDTLRTSGAIQSPAWADAFAAVPRHIFVPSPFEQVTDDSGVTSWLPLDAVGREPWLEAVYAADRTLVTSVDPKHGMPTSSSTLPSLMARMLEELEVEDGHRVLEIGTGTGYNAALLSARLGDRNVYSVDIDPELVEAAAAHLAVCGYRPHGAAADGREGFAAGAPFDRIIATCSVTSVPAAWLEQMRPGGLILADLETGIEHGLLRLTIEGRGQASGRFTRTTGRFMAARAGEKSYAERDAIAFAPTEGTRTSTVTSADYFGNYPFRLLLGTALPHVRFVYHREDGVVSIQLQHPDGSWARTPMPGQGEAGHVTFGGPQHLWDHVEALWRVWRDDHGSPDQTQVGLTIDGNGQCVWLGSPDGPTWRLPA